ncbi:MAG: hypothetical protein H6587_13085 [Flavobacteriales bacterium]|nr:hypothetical protein [Flavobacteriales bacterium]
MKQEIGICHLFNCNLLAYNFIKFSIIFSAIILSILYILEKWMLLTTLGLSFISMYIFSAGNSNGIFYRSEVLSAILIVQFFAYLFFYFNKNKPTLELNRFRYPIQVIAAIYVLSAIKKLKTTGFSWVLKNEEFAAQAKKSIQIEHANWGFDILSYANFIYETLSNNPNFVILILVISLLIELFAFVMIFSKKLTTIYGIILLLFHLGIFLTMFVYVPPIIIILITFVLNIPYLLYAVVKN